jgi:ketosteroid isomerase-like protein
VSVVDVESTSDNVMRIIAGYEAWNRSGDATSILSELDPAVEIEIPADALDYGGVVFHGHEGVRHALEVLLEPWSETKFEPLEFVEVGDRVLVICRQRSWGRHTNLELAGVVAHLWTAGEDGKAIRLELFFDADQSRRELSSG